MEWLASLYFAAAILDVCKDTQPHTHIRYRHAGCTETLGVTRWIERHAFLAPTRENSLHEWMAAGALYVQEGPLVFAAAALWTRLNSTTTFVKHYDNLCML